MAELTQAQRQALDQMISGTFNSLGASPSYMSPNTSVSDMYAGIYPPATQQAPQQTYQSGMLGRGQPSPVGSPYLTAEERTLLQQQIADSQKLQNPTLDITMPYSEPTQYANARWGADLPQRQPTSGWDENDPMTLLANQNAAAFMASPGKANLDARADPNSPLMAYSSSDAQPMRQQPPLTPSQRYAITNAIAANRQGGTGTTAAGYTYDKGKQVGKAAWAQGLTPSQQYATANQAAMDFMPKASGVGTNGYIYQNGVNVGSTRAPGTSASDQYNQANAAASQRAKSKSTTKSTSGGTYGTSSSGRTFDGTRWV